MNKKSSPKTIEILELFGVLLLLIFNQGFVLPAPIPSIFNIGSYGILFLLTIRRWQQIAYVAKSDKSLFLLVTLAVASVLWSENASYTLDYAKGLIRTTLIGLYFGIRYKPREQMRLLSWIFLLSMLLSLCSSVLIPDYGTHVINGAVAWRGVYEHKQRFGPIMAFAASLMTINLFDRHSKHCMTFIGMILSLILLRFANSATGLIMFSFTIALLPLYKIAKQQRYRAFYLLLLLLFSSTILILFLTNIQFIVVDIFGKNLEFNGRVPIWNLAIEKGLERPILGYGYYGFWGSEASNYVINNSWLGNEDMMGVDGTKSIANLSHNGFLEMFLNLGFLGLFLCLFNFLAVMYRITILLLKIRSIEYFWMLVFLGINFVANSSDSMTFIMPNNLFWITYVSIAFSSQLFLKKNKSKNNSIKHCFMSP